MSKGLEALESIELDYCLMDDRTETIEKELKALEIIKEHTLYCENVNCFVFVNMTDEITNLLKEILL